MKTFLTELNVTPGPDGRRWQLLSPLIWCTDLSSDGDIITVPTGFISDFASVPRFLWDLYPPEGRWDWAAVVHDYLYENGGVIPGSTKVYTKLEADQIFRDGMQRQGVGPVTRNIMYIMVRKFGRGNFK